MDWPLALGLMLGLACFLLAIGLPVAFAFFLTNIVGVIVFMGLDRGMVWLLRNSVAAISNFNLAPIPLFLLMGELLLQTGLAFKAVDAIDRIIRRVPGRGRAVRPSLGRGPPRILGDAGSAAADPGAVLDHLADVDVSPRRLAAPGRQHALPVDLRRQH